MKDSCDSIFCDSLFKKANCDCLKELKIVPYGFVLYGFHKTKCRIVPSFCMKSLIIIDSH